MAEGEEDWRRLCIRMDFPCGDVGEDMHACSAPARDKAEALLKGKKMGGDCV